MSHASTVNGQVYQQPMKLESPSHTSLEGRAAHQQAISGKKTPPHSAGSKSPAGTAKDHSQVPTGGSQANARKRNSDSVIKVSTKSNYFGLHQFSSW